MIRPLGPDGIRARMDALQARIDTKLPTTRFPEVAAPAENSGLRGEITPSGTQAVSLGPLPGVAPESGLAPMNPFGDQATVAGIQRAPQNLQGPIIASAQKSGIEPALLEALVSVESDFRSDLVSNKGAQGLAQLMPGTATALGVKDPFDPDQNLAGGAKYLAQMMRQFGDVRLALAAYNAGPGAVERSGGIPPYRETRNYVNKVMARYEALRQAQ